MTVGSDLRFVHLVDDDDAIRRSAGFMLKTSGFQVQSYESGAELLKNAGSLKQGCILLDIRMPGMDGLALQQHLKERACALPVIIITGHGDVDLARTAFKAQARDFLEKPLDESKLICAIEDVFAEVRTTQSVTRQRDGALSLLPSLTPREQQVMQLVVGGKHNREIAVLLMISPRTVEVHKARLMSKLGVGNVADLVRISMLGGAD